MRLFITATVLAATLSSCSFIERNTVGLFDATTPTEAQVGSVASGTPSGEGDATTSTRADHATSSSAVASAPSETAPSPTDIEIVWEIPNSPVDSYLIRYGSSRNDLSKEVKVDVTDLTRLDDPDHGFVFRYLLKGFAPDQPVFVTIAAIREDQLSAPSQVFEVGPS